MKVMLGAASFLQTAVVPIIDAVGNGFTVIVADPVSVCEHVVTLESLTLKRVYIKVPAKFVGAAIVTLFPLEVLMVWFVPPLME
jgi:hypothetical protein